MRKPDAQVNSINLGLVLSFFDASYADHWVQTDPEAALESSFTGHPAAILAAFDEGMPAIVDLGPGKAVALEVEGTKGQADFYCLRDDFLVVVEPTYEWCVDPDNGFDRGRIDAVFADLLRSAALGEGEGAKGGEEMATLELPSGRLAAMDLWHLKVATAKAAAAKLARGAAAPVRDSKGPAGKTGAVVSLVPGTYRIVRVEADCDDPEIVAVYFIRKT